jgi:hypothetical protein
VTTVDIIGLGGYYEVAAIKRETTPPGPITDLFDRLDDLHSKAGRPSMREIAIRAGRGNISRIPKILALKELSGTPVSSSR